MWCRLHRVTEVQELIWAEVQELIWAEGTAPEHGLYV